VIEPPLSPADPDRTSALFWLAVIVLPLVARILRGLREKAEGKSEERPRGRLPSQREAQRRLEEEGGDLWRRLARGDVPEVKPVERPARPPRPARTPVREAKAPALEGPSPLSVLGEVSDPGEASEVSLEAAVASEDTSAPAPLAALETSPPLGTARRRRLPLRLGTGDLRRAIVMNEILSMPVALRDPAREVR